MHGPGKLIYENEEYYSGEFIRGESYAAFESAMKCSHNFEIPRQTAWSGWICVLRWLNFQRSGMSKLKSDGQHVDEIYA